MFALRILKLCQLKSVENSIREKMFDSQKIIRIKEMRFIKSATALHLNHGSKLGFVLSEESNERVTAESFIFSIFVVLFKT